MEALILFFKFLIGHALGDFVLQPAPMSTGKNRNNRLREQYGEGFPSWHYWLSAHALTHAGLVYVASGSALFAFIEAVSHWAIDYCKCERWINLHQDQAIHLLFKVGYCVLFMLQSG